jgi:hypothetical protein
VDDIVYVLDRQGIIKTYISRVIVKQWFTKDGTKKTKTTYCIPEEEVGEQAEKTKFVLDDFGKIIFTSYDSAIKKFKSLSQYQNDNETATGEGEEDLPEEPYYNWTTTEDVKDADDDYDEIYEVAPDMSGYIKVDSSSSNKEGTQNPVAADTSERTGYYTTDGKRVYPDSNGTFIDVKGDVIKINYYDSSGNTIIHRGTYLGKGEYVYEDGTIVPKGVKILRYMELYGNASIKDGVQIKPIPTNEVPERIDMDTDTEIID